VGSPMPSCGAYWGIGWGEQYKRNTRSYCW